jgi:signal peptidase I
MRFDDGLGGYQVYRGGKPLACRDGSGTLMRGERRGADRQGDKETRRQGDGQVAAGERLVTVSLVDQQFLLALDNRTLVQWPYRRSQLGGTRPGQNLSRRDASRPFALGVEGIDVRIEQLRVYRDVYYAAPVGLPAMAGPVTLGADEYFLLGDNSPVSEDSRLWPNRGVVDGKLLWAKPFVVVPSSVVDWGKCGHFQVPNFGGIRYIP